MLKNQQTEIKFFDRPFFLFSVFLALMTITIKNLAKNHQWVKNVKTKTVVYLLYLVLAIIESEGSEGGE